MDKKHNLVLYSRQLHFGSPVCWKAKRRKYYCLLLIFIHASDIALLKMVESFILLKIKVFVYWTKIGLNTKKQISMSYIFVSYSLNISVSLGQTCISHFLPSTAKPPFGGAKNPCMPEHTGTLGLFSTMFWQVH